MTRHRTLPGACLLTLACLMASAHAAGKIEVRYIEPARFSDAGRSGIDRDRTMKTLGDYLQTLAAQLPDGQTLQLEVLDIDLAGELRPSFGGQDVRVLRGGADWPRVKLRYTLQAGGQTLKAGQADISDMDYLREPTARALWDTDLPYEKRMLLKWFDATFVAP
jgi:hypothetical protein